MQEIDLLQQKKIMIDIMIALRTNKECSFKQKVKNVVAEIWKKTIAPDIKTLIDEYNCIAKKYNYDNSNYVGEISVYGGKTSRHKKEIFNGYTLIEFEGHKFRAPLDYNPWLMKFRAISIPEKLERTHLKEWLDHVWIVDFEQVEVILQESEWKGFFPEEWLNSGEEDCNGKKE